MEPPTLLTRAQAAELLTVSRSTLDRMTRAGELPVVRLGHLVRYRLADLVTYVDEHTGRA